jgi:hypothetical protein
MLVCRKDERLVSRVSFFISESRAAWQVHSEPILTPVSLFSVFLSKVETHLHRRLFMENGDIFRTMSAVPYSQTLVWKLEI